MAESNFVIKNGLVVNGSFVANSSAVNAAAIAATSLTVGTVSINATTINVGTTTINSTTYSGSAASANNALFLGGAAAASYAQLAGPTFTGNVATGNVLTIGTASYFVSNGNVGIGTTTPATKLSVNGTITLVGAANATINSTAYSGTANNANNLGGTAAASYALLAGPTFTGSVTTANVLTVGTASYFVANGNVGVGTAAPDYKLSIQSNDVAISFKDSGGTTRGYIGVAGISGTAPTGALRLRSDQGGFVFNQSGTDTATLSSAGNFSITGNQQIMNGKYIALFEATNNNQWQLTNALNTLDFVYNGNSRARLTLEGNLQFNSGYGSVATAYGVRAWAAYNGQTQTTIGAGNITVTRTDTGNYRFTFTNALPDTNYCVTIGLGDTSGTGNEYARIASRTTTYVDVITYQSFDTTADNDYVAITVVR